MNKTIQLVSLILLANTCCYIKTVCAGSIQESIPSSPNIDSRYIFFLHGKIVEKKGDPATSRKYGDYEYKNMLKTFEESGFEVISEVRSSGTDIYDYSAKVAEDVDKLISSGVPAKNITVSGFSKGGRMTLVVSSLLGNKDINYVVLAGCRSSDIDNLDLSPSGRVLSIYDSDDDKFESCAEIFSSGDKDLVSKEIVLDIGDGHGVFYNPIDEWVKPLVSWSKQ
jgi:hypothetical protein